MDKRTDLQQPNLPGEFSLLSCTVCQHQIPVSAALWRESSDYVVHFCGLECYDRWRQQ